MTSEHALKDRIAMHLRDTLCYVTFAPVRSTAYLWSDWDPRDGRSHFQSHRFCGCSKKKNKKNKHTKKMDCLPVPVTLWLFGWCFMEDVGKSAAALLCNVKFHTYTALQHPDVEQGGKKKKPGLINARNNSNVTTEHKSRVCVIRFMEGKPKHLFSTFCVRARCPGQSQSSCTSWERSAWAPR